MQFHGLRPASVSAPFSPVRACVQLYTSVRRLLAYHSISSRLCIDRRVRLKCLQVL